MKVAAAILFMLFFLSGCSAGNRPLERGIEIRSELLSADRCDFDAEITADYGDRLNFFSVSCESDKDGIMRFTVMEPKSISGITGMFASDGGRLTFEDKALFFDTMAEGLISPVSAPWVFLSALKSGYITSAGMEEDLLRMTINDTYEEDALQLDIWFNSEDKPVRAEFLHKNRRIISMDVKDYVLK